MHHFMVDAATMNLVMPMRCRVMPMLCHMVRMADQRSARTMPKHLSVTQPVAEALGLARVTRGVVAGVPRAPMGMVRTAMSVRGSTTADIDPAVRRADSRHWRKRRRCFGSGLRVRRRNRWNCRRGLLRRGKRLVGRGLLRG